MSNTPLGHGWWQATDGKYYPPEQHPDYVSPDALDTASSTSGATQPPVDEAMYGSPPTINPYERAAHQGHSHGFRGPTPQFDSAVPSSREPQGELGTSQFKVVKQRRKYPTLLVRSIGAAVLVCLVLGTAFVAYNTFFSEDAPTSGGTIGTREAASTSNETEIERAAEQCGLSLDVGDNGSSITLDTKGEDDFTGHDWDEVLCVLNGLDVPDRVIARMNQTRALDGTLDASWGEYEAFWNYHPDHGVNLTVFIAD